MMKLEFNHRVIFHQAIPFDLSYALQKGLQGNEYTYRAILYAVNHQKLFLTETKVIDLNDWAKSKKPFSSHHITASRNVVKCYSDTRNGYDILAIRFKGKIFYNWYFPVKIEGAIPISGHVFENGIAGSCGRLDISVGAMLLSYATNRNVIHRYYTELRASTIIPCSYRYGVKETLMNKDVTLYDKVSEIDFSTIPLSHPIFTISEEELLCHLSYLDAHSASETKAVPLHLQLRHRSNVAIDKFLHKHFRHLNVSWHDHMHRARTEIKVNPNESAIFSSLGDYVYVNNIGLYNTANLSDEKNGRKIPKHMIKYVLFRGNMETPLLLLDKDFYTPLDRAIKPFEYKVEYKPSKILLDWCKKDLTIPE